MPTTRKRKRRTANALQPWELAYLTGDESTLRPGTRDAAKLKTMRADPDSFLISGNRTARELVKAFPEYKKKVPPPRGPKNAANQRKSKKNEENA